MSLIPGIAPLNSLLAYKSNTLINKQQTNVNQTSLFGEKKSNSTKQLFQVNESDEKKSSSNKQLFQANENDTGKSTLFNAKPGEFSLMA